MYCRNIFKDIKSRLNEKKENEENLLQTSQRWNRCCCNFLSFACEACSQFFFILRKDTEKWRALKNLVKRTQARKRKQGVAFKPQDVLSVCLNDLLCLWFEWKEREREEWNGMEMYLHFLSLQQNLHRVMNLSGWLTRYIIACVFFSVSCSHNFNSIPNNLLSINLTRSQNRRREEHERDLKLNPNNSLSLFRHQLNDFETERQTTCICFCWGRQTTEPWTFENERKMSWKGVKYGKIVWEGYRNEWVKGRERLVYSGLKVGNRGVHSFPFHSLQPKSLFSLSQGSSVEEEGRDVCRGESSWGDLRDTEESVNHREGMKKDRKKASCFEWEHLAPKVTKTVKEEKGSIVNLRCQCIQSPCLFYSLHVVCLSLSLFPA